MALVIEDGSGVANADSWVSLADYKAYWTARGVQSVIDASDDQNEADLRNAATYLGIAYRWPGQPTSLEQELCWPRSGVPSGAGIFSSAAIPSQVISAQMVLAVEARTTPLLQKATAPEKGAVVEDTKSVKGITKTIRYANPTAPVDYLSGLPRFPVVDQILYGIATSGAGGDFGTAKLVRTA